MARKHWWLRLIGLVLLAEACLWLMGTCRPWFNVGGNVDSSRILLIQTGTETMSVEHSSVTTVSFSEWESPVPLRKLQGVMKRILPDRGARRTLSGTLVGTKGRVLLPHVGTNVLFAYSPEHDLLVWANRYDTRLNIRHGERVRTISTWNVQDVQLRPDSTIWLAESRGDALGYMAGIAALDSQGYFLGWRSYGGLPDIESFAEVTPEEEALVKRLLAQAGHSYISSDY